MTESKQKRKSKLKFGLFRFINKKRIVLLINPQTLVNKSDIEGVKEHGSKG